MTVRRILDRWRDRRARELYQRYGAHPWHLLDERTRVHYRQLVSDGLTARADPCAGGRCGCDAGGRLFSTPGAPPAASGGARQAALRSPGRT
jgi:hypothetical protein